MPKYIVDIDTDTLEATIKPVEPGPVKIPRYIRGLYHTHMREPLGLPRESPPEEHAKKIIEIDPADIYVWVHGPDKPEIIAELKKLGKEVWFTTNLMKCRYGAINWDFWGWYKVIETAMKFWKIQLVDDKGQDVQYRWFGQGPIINWAKVNDSVMDWMVYGGEGWWQNTPGIFMMDVVNPDLKQWMLLKGESSVQNGEYTPEPGETPISQEMLDTYYDKELYHQNILKFLDKFEHANRGRQIFLNGEDDYWDRPPHDFNIMMENANRRRPWADDFDAALARWSERPLNILEVRKPTPTDGPLAWKNIEKAVAYWLDHPEKILWLDNPHHPLYEADAAQYAIAERKARYGV